MKNTTVTKARPHAQRFTRTWVIAFAAIAMGAYESDSYATSNSNGVVSAGTTSGTVNGGVNGNATTTPSYPSDNVTANQGPNAATGTTGSARRGAYTRNTASGSLHSNTSGTHTGRGSIGGGTIGAGAGAGTTTDAPAGAPAGGSTSGH